MINKVKQQLPLRRRDGGRAAVSNVELFFDLVYVFAVTQLSHRLLESLTIVNALQTLVLWFAVWLAWQYTCWFTNWFDPDRMPVRTMLFGAMAASLVAAAAIPEAFDARGAMFAVGIVAIQVGRTLFALACVGRDHALAANFRRMLAWLLVSGVLWLWGGFGDPSMRLPLWILAVLVEYVAPMTGFRFPGLGRSQTSDWTIDGGHLAERCQLFVIVALGESLLMTGATLAHGEHWDAPLVIAFIVAFIGALAMWWVYFDTGSRAASEAIEHSADPGRMGAIFHYLHVALVGSVIVAAVGNELAIAHPDGHITTPTLAVLIVAPFVYLLANALFKRVVFGRFPLSHAVGLVLLAVLVPFGYRTDLLMVNGLTTLVLIVVAVWEMLGRRGGHPRSMAA